MTLFANEVSTYLVYKTQLNTDNKVWVVQKVVNSIHWINHYPVVTVVYFVNTFQLGSELSSG